MLPADPSLSIAERVDAACERFEAEWRSGTKPRIATYVAAAPESDREVLRHALHTIARELQGRSEAETSVTRSSVRSGESPAPVATVDHVPREELSSGSIGRFEILGVLGAGAFGRVYQAFDPQLSREVAVKVPLESTLRTEVDRTRFLKEARSAATINHPNVCQVHEVGEADGQPYIVMALVRGQTLADILKARKQPLPEEQAAMVVRKIALALESAHEKGIIHRDLKPANVMFDRERKDIVVMDFGLARAQQFGDARGTQSGVVMGTPAYMSPEQARGDAKGVGPAGDIFSLGVILYELLTGVRPFSGTATEVIGQILHIAPEPPSCRRPGIDSRIETVCLKAMAKDPAERFASMKEFAKAIDAILRAPVPAGGDVETARASTTRREGDDQSTNTSSNLTEVFAALSADRKQVRDETAAVVEAALAKHRTPRWVFTLIGLLFVAGLMTLAGIVFFTKSDTVMVTIELTDVDLADKSLSFFLDDEPIAAEALANPIELTPGEHVLVVKRGKDIVKRMLLTVAGGRSPDFRVKDITPPPTESKVAGDDPGPRPEDYQRYTAGPWTPLWNTEEAVRSAVRRGKEAEDVTFQNGTLHVRNNVALRGPGPVRNLVVRLRLKQEEGKGLLLCFRTELTQPDAAYTMHIGRYTNWINGYKAFGLSRHFDGTHLGFGNAQRKDLRNGHYYEWLGVADGDFIAIYINGELILKMKDNLIQRGYFVLEKSDGEATIKGAEYRILDETPPDAVSLREE